MPDTAVLLDHLQEELVHAQVVRQLGVEGREQQSPIAHEDGLAVELAEHLDALADAANARRPDEHAVKRDLVAGQVDVRLEALAPAVRRRFDRRSRSARSRCSRSSTIIPAQVPKTAP